MNANDRARDIMLTQRARRKSFRCGLCGRWTVPSHDPYAVPMCSIHGSENMIEWTDEYRYAENYLSTVARAQGPELLEIWAGEVDLREWSGVTRPGLEYVLELMRFWRTLPAKDGDRRPLTIFGRKRPPVPPEQRYDFEAHRGLDERGVPPAPSGQASRHSDATSCADQDAERTPHNHGIHQKGCTPLKRSLGWCECVFPNCKECK